MEELCLFINHRNKLSKLGPTMIILLRCVCSYSLDRYLFILFSFYVFVQFIYFGLNRCECHLDFDQIIEDKTPLCEKLAADEKLAVCDGNAESRMRHISLSSYLLTFHENFFINLPRIFFVKLPGKMFVNKDPR